MADAAQSIAEYQARMVERALEAAGLSFDAAGRLGASHNAPEQALRDLLAAAAPERLRVTHGRMVSREGAIGPEVACLIVDRLTQSRLAPAAARMDEPELVLADAVLGVFAVRRALSRDSFGAALEQLHEALAQAGFDPAKARRSVSAGANGLSPNPCFGLLSLEHEPDMASIAELTACTVRAARAGRSFDLAASLSGLCLLPLAPDGRPMLHVYDLPRHTMRHTALIARDAADARLVIARTLGAVAFLTCGVGGRRPQADAFQRVLFGG